MKGERPPDDAGESKNLRCLLVAAQSQSQCTCTVSSVAMAATEHASGQASPGSRKIPDDIFTAPWASLQC